VTIDDRLVPLFKSIDRKDTDAFVSFLSENVVFRFGNAEPVRGKASVRDAVHGFFGSIKALHHVVHESWDTGSALVCHGIVTYTRHDSSTLTVPFANVLTVENGLFSEYLIFADVSELYTGA
jgi:ketosteroid isomerase-like protein